MLYSTLPGNHIQETRRGALSEDNDRSITELFADSQDPVQTYIYIMTEKKQQLNNVEEFGLGSCDYGSLVEYRSMNILVVYWKNSYF